MKKLLLIIDPQQDFIFGSLPVPGAAEAMESLAQYIADKGTAYEAIAITADWHPWNHFSFKEFGGPWPRHCVQFSIGASIFPPVFEAAFSTNGNACVLTKGTSSEKEEYSIFCNEKSKSELLSLISRHKIQEIDICGLAGDVCVCDTYIDAKKLMPEMKIKVLEKFSPSIDGGLRLSETIKQSK